MAVLVFVAAILQVTLFSSAQILGGTPDVVLLTLVAIALLRGSIYGASAGFAAGFLVDTANLGTLGVTSLLLTIAGYWIGRYGETTGRDRGHAPFVSVAVMTVLIQFGALFLHYMLGDSVSARVVLLDALPAKVLLNLVLTLPVYALVRRARRSRRRPRARRRCSSLASTRAGRSGSNRFLPPDPRVEEPYRFTPQLALRLGILGAVALIAFGILFFRLWALQVLSGPQYLRAALDNQVRTMRVEGQRGEIFDRNGKPLVGNVPGTAVQVWPANLPKTWPARLAELRQLSHVLRVPLRQLLVDIKRRGNRPDHAGDRARIGQPRRADPLPR